MVRLAEVNGWSTRTRDDAGVVAELHRDRVIDSVHALDQVAFFDEFFHYVRECGLWPDLEGLDPKTRKGPIYPFIQFVTMTIMRCVGGVQSMIAMHDLLLTDEALMAAVGFNADQVKHGANRRGEDRRKEPVEIQGALSYETIADNLVTIELAKLEKLFNAAICALAAQGLFGPVALGNITNHAGHQQALPSLERAQTHLGRKLAAVLATSHQRVTSTDRARARGGGVAGAMLHMARAQLLGQQQVDRLAKQLVAPVAKQQLGLVVDDHNLALAVDDYDRVGG